MPRRTSPECVLLISMLMASCSGAPAPVASGRGAGYDLVLRGGTVYDGRGGEPFVGDVAFRGDRIAA
ncbi:MAG TPA: D-aminoacylase, partial [Thermoanaerobaculia bacterium]|nr:D-aminoacylase [Thermoanaerobaculia bacterium]